MRELLNPENRWAPETFNGRHRRRLQEAWPRIIAVVLGVVLLGFSMYRHAITHRHHGGHNKHGKLSDPVVQHEMEVLLVIVGVVALCLGVFWRRFWEPVRVYKEHLETGKPLPKGFMRMTAGKKKAFE